MFIGILFLIVLLVTTVFYIAEILWTILSLIFSNWKIKVTSFLTFISVILAAASWIYGLGGLRILLTGYFFTFVNVIVLTIMSFVSSKYIKSSHKLFVYNLVYILSYTVAHVFLPDSNLDFPYNSFCFFGLVQLDERPIVYQSLLLISAVAFLIHVTMFVLMIVEMIKCKRRSKSIPALKEAGGTYEKT